MPLGLPKNVIKKKKKKDFIYLFMRDREREAEGEAGPTQGAQHGTQSRVSTVRPWAEGGTKPLSRPGFPEDLLLVVYSFSRGFELLFP